ncbi:ketopantoate reductase family protein [Palleronia sp.]|uniref:ketopantoate reductase family protein n=1 Tax=Palleronia sp. TaxID=1940284 RepID=UPI0035C80340
MKVAILGAGALGGVIGAELYRSGLDVVLLDTDQAHLGAIRERGLRVDWDDRTEHLMIPAMQPAEAPDLDLVILLTKTLHSIPALEAVRRQINAGACVLTLQNGLGNVERVLSVVPPGQVLFGCTMTPGDLRGPGHVASHGMAYTPFNAIEEHGPAAGLAGELERGGMTQAPAAEAQIWQKAAFNCAMNAAAVLGQGTVADIARFVGQSMAERIAEEVLRVGECEGVQTDREAVAKQIAFALEAHGAHKASMLQDMEAGRRTEIEALNGYVAKRGVELGVEVPLNTLLAALVRMREAQLA